MIYIPSSTTKYESLDIYDIDGSIDKIISEMRLKKTNQIPRGSIISNIAGLFVGDNSNPKVYINYHVANSDIIQFCKDNDFRKVLSEDFKEFAGPIDRSYCVTEVLGLRVIAIRLGGFDKNKRMKNYNITFVTDLVVIS